MHRAPSWTLRLAVKGVRRVGGGRRRRCELTEAFRGVLGIKVVLRRPGDPEAKGLVERARRYFETSFLPGRTFGSPEDFGADGSTLPLGSHGWL